MKNKFSLNLEVTLVEIIFSILIFVIAAVIMLNCFFIARFTQLKANDKVIAGNIVQSNIETIKSFNNIGDAEKFLIDNFQLFNNEQNVQTYINFYNKNWEISRENDYEYLLTLVVSEHFTDNGTIKNIELIAEKVKPYPFINKDNSNQFIYVIETNKFYPSN